MSGESRESEPPRQEPGNTRQELAKTTTPAVRSPGLPTPTRRKAALADTSRGGSQSLERQVSSAAPRPPASPAPAATQGARRAAGWGRGRRRCRLRSNLSRTLPPRPPGARRQPPPPSGGRRPTVQGRRQVT